MGTPLVPGWVAGSSRNQSPRLSLGVVKVCWTGDFQPSGMSTSGATRFSTELRQEVGDAWDLPTVVVIRRREWPGERTMTSVEGDSSSAALEDSTLSRHRIHRRSGQRVGRMKGFTGWCADYFVAIGFQTLAKPSPSKSLMLAVAKSVTPKACKARAVRVRASESGQARFPISKGGVSELFGCETLPADTAGRRWCPIGIRWGIRFRIDLQQQFSTSPESFGEGPFASFGKGSDLTKEFLRNLDLRFRHAG
jgi:hypothetical protein